VVGLAVGGSNVVGSEMNGWTLVGSMVVGSMVIGAIVVGATVVGERVLEKTHPTNKSQAVPERGASTVTPTKVELPTPTGWDRHIESSRSANESICCE